ncbi:MAG: hypothetical protein QM528_02565 [Phycisphaerales bacterium]|nr:hypothetical protein [Phycisphaerales bacterium]
MTNEHEQHLNKHDMENTIGVCHHESCAHKNKGFAKSVIGALIFFIILITIMAHYSGPFVPPANNSATDNSAPTILK